MSDPKPPSPPAEPRRYRDGGTADWLAELPPEDVTQIADPAHARPVHWVEGVGFVEGPAPADEPS